MAIAGNSEDFLEGAIVEALVHFFNVKCGDFGIVSESSYLNINNEKLLPSPLAEVEEPIIFIASTFVPRKVSAKESL